MKFYKKGQINFVWIFAILAGGAILALAIWGAMQTGDVLRYKGDTESAKSVSILTDPLQAGFADGSFGKMFFNKETRINNICLNDGEFGKNDISVASRSDIGEEWNLAGGATSVYNKYIFSKETNIGFDYYVFSKPFEFPYEVSDLIFLMDKEYCFDGAPDEIADEILGLGIENIALENCSDEAYRVCFGGGRDCDAIVYGQCLGAGCDSAYDLGSVSKDGTSLDFVGSLMWGAIFSDEAVYECNVERLMLRTESIADIFAAKADLMDARDCGTNLKGDLIAWANMVKGSGSGDLTSLFSYSNNLGNRNDREVCGVW